LPPDPAVPDVLADPPTPLVPPEPAVVDELLAVPAPPLPAAAVVEDEPLPPEPCRGGSSVVDVQLRMPAVATDQMASFRLFTGPPPPFAFEGYIEEYGRSGLETFDASR
jgi:hypothetical protein